MNTKVTMLSNLKKIIILLHQDIWKINCNFTSTMIELFFNFTREWINMELYSIIIRFIVNTSRLEYKKIHFWAYYFTVTQRVKQEFWKLAAGSDKNNNKAHQQIRRKANQTDPIFQPHSYVFPLAHRELENRPSYVYISRT